jgi:hypothetical protein
MTIHEEMTHHLQGETVVHRIRCLSAGLNASPRATRLPAEAWITPEALLVGVARIAVRKPNFVVERFEAFDVIGVEEGETAVTGLQGAMERKNATHALGRAIGAGEPIPAVVVVTRRGDVTLAWLKNDRGAARQAFLAIAEAFLQSERDVSDPQHQPGRSDPDVAARASSLVDDVTRLGALFTQGLLTQAEFVAMKQHLIATAIAPADGGESPTASPGARGQLPPVADVAQTSVFNAADKTSLLEAEFDRLVREVPTIKSFRRRGDEWKRFQDLDAEFRSTLAELHTEFADSADDEPTASRLREALEQRVRPLVNAMRAAEADIATASERRSRQATDWE